LLERRNFKELKKNYLRLRRKKRILKSILKKLLKLGLIKSKRELMLEL